MDDVNKIHLVICGRMAHKEEMYEIGKTLATAGFGVTIPQGAHMPFSEVEDDLRQYFQKSNSRETSLNTILVK